jgi:hypothetical protein
MCESVSFQNLSFETGTNLPGFRMTLKTQTIQCTVKVKPLKSRGQFLVFRGSWAPLRPSFLLENLPLQSTEFYKKLSSFFKTFAPNNFVSKRGEKLTVKNCTQLPINKNSTPRVDYLFLGTRKFTVGCKLLWSTQLINKLFISNSFNGLLLNYVTRIGESIKYIIYGWTLVNTNSVPTRTLNSVTFWAD